MSYLTHEQWEFVLTYIEEWRRAGGHRRSRVSDRAVIEALMWLDANRASSWRDLPQIHPNWRTVKRRARQWQRDSVMDEIRACLAGFGIGIWPRSHS